MSARSPHRTAFLGASFLGLALALGAACTSSGGSSSATTATRPSTTVARTGGSATTTAGHATTVAPTTTAPLVYFPDRDTAVKHLIDAWKANDATAALQGADPTAVVNLFTQKADGFELYGQQEGDAPTLTDNYRNRARGYYAQITSERSAKGWRVIGVYMSTDG